MIGKKRGPQRIEGEPPLKGRDKVGHGKRRRKRPPSRACVEIHLGGGWITGQAVQGNLRHVGQRNLGKKPK